MPGNVLVVDDSAVVRTQMREILEANGYRVSTAANGREALESLRSHRPDAITLDVNMPQMSGLEMLSELRALGRAPPVIMVSAMTSEGAGITLRALELGAFDFVCKPNGSFSRDMATVARELLSKLEAALGSVRARPAPQRTAAPLPIQTAPALRSARPAAAGDGQFQAPLFLIGASTGGPRALQTVLAALDADFPGAIVVAQHMPETFTGVFASRLNTTMPISVTEVTKRTELLPACCYIARGGADCVISEVRGKVFVQSVPKDSAATWHPSVNRLVESALVAVEPRRLFGVLLTGMGDDGATSFARLRQLGGKVIAESQDSCVVYGMPMRLVELGGASRILHQDMIGAEMMRDAEPFRTRAAGLQSTRPMGERHGPRQG